MLIYNIFSSLHWPPNQASLLRLCSRGSRGNNPLCFHLCLNLKIIKYRWSKDNNASYIQGLACSAQFQGGCQRLLPHSASDHVWNMVTRSPSVPALWWWKMARVVFLSEHYDITRKLTFEHNIVLSFHHFHPLHCACGLRLIYGTFPKVDLRSKLHLPEYKDLFSYLMPWVVWDYGLGSNEHLQKKRFRSKVHHLCVYTLRQVIRIWKQLWKHNPNPPKHPTLVFHIILLICYK